MNSSLESHETHLHKTTIRRSRESEKFHFQWDRKRSKRVRRCQWSRNAKQYENNLIIGSAFLTFLSSSFAGDKPHHCDLCGKKFALACNLRAHMKTHDDEPQEQCVRCGKEFLVSSSDIREGICRKCEDEPVSVDEEEAKEEVVEILIRHKKFNHKFLSQVAAHWKSEFNWNSKKSQPN